MPGKPYPTDIIEQARDVAEAWNQIDPDLTIGELTRAMLQADVDEVTPVTAQINALETQLTNLRNQRDAQYGSVWDKITRARNGIKGIYGDDSSQYEMVGGTRLSERKTPSRKASA